MKLQSRLLLFSSYLWELGEGMLGPLFAIFSQRVGGDVFDITIAWSAFLIATGVFIIIIGEISDKVSKEKFLVTGYALNALLTFGYLLVHTQTELLIIQVGLGFATALATPTWDALYSIYEDKGEAGFLWSLDSGGKDIVTGIAILIGGYVLVHFSFTTLFIIMGCIQVAATAYVFPLLWKKAD